MKGFQAITWAVLVVTMLFLASGCSSPDSTAEEFRRGREKVKIGLSLDTLKKKGGRKTETSLPLRREELGAEVLVQVGRRR